MFEEKSFIASTLSLPFISKSIQFSKNIQIDSKTIVMMTEDELKNIIPKYGDRVAIMNYCKKINTGKKQSLIEKLRMKLNEKGTKKPKEEKAVSKRRRKQTRFIEIGWVCSDKNSNDLKYVRTQKGGGTRRISIDASSKCGDILEKSLSLFFPRGESTRGKLHIFDYELLDYQRLKCDLNLTVLEMYELSALSTLRFYLSTTYKEGIVSSDCEHDEDEEIATCVTEYAPQLRRSQRLTQTRTAFCSSSDLVEEATDGQKETSEIVDPTGRTDDHLLVFIDESLDGIERNLEQHSTFVDLMPPQLSGFDDNPMHRIPVTMHRGRVLYELIEACKLYEDISILQITMISPNEEQEMAEDMGGVMRDEHTMSSETNKVFGFLKRYIRDINDTKRSMFLRFCTGSDIVNKDIEVTFTDISVLGRRPIAHTCSCYLELPHTYEDYISFRNEFNGLFSCNVWTMDLV